MRAIGYARCSTREQADSGLGLDAQRSALTAEAARRGWELTLIEDAGFTARNVNRPGLRDALARLKRGEADVIVVAKLDRLSRSVQDFAGLLRTADRQGWSLVALDMQVDTTSPNGRLVAHILMAVAQWESEVIGARTRDAMAEAKAKGQRFGYEHRADTETVTRVRDLRDQGLSYAKIAAHLDASGVPTPAGGQRWYPAAVRRLVLASQPDAA